MKTILILGAGIEQKIAIKAAKNLNYNVVACDQKENSPGFEYADIALVTDINNVDLVESVAREYEVDGVFAHAVEIPYIVAKVALRLGLPGMPPYVARRATNKIERIEYLTKKGIPCAAFEIVNNEDELKIKADKMKFPCILKPVDSAGSRGVQLVGCMKDLKDAYEEAIRYSKKDQVLLEELLCGDEVSTESVVYKNKVYTFALADRNYVNSNEFKPYFIENGINYPSKLSSKMQNDIYNLVERTIKALDIRFGAAKGDIIIDNGSPKVIEMAARTSGGWFGAGSIPAATGCNMIVPLLQMAVGDAPNLDLLKPTRHLGCAQRYLIPSSEGVVSEINGVEDAQKSSGVVMSEFFLPEVGTTISPAKNHAERFGHIICTAETRSMAIDYCESAISKISIKLS